MEQAAVSRTYDDGVAAIAAVTAEFGDGQWASPACGAWSAVETVRHVAAVADWYHDWLDRAISGDTTKPFAADQIDVMTERSLATFGHLDGPAAVKQFTSRATEYRDRLSDHWELPYAYPFGHVSAGLHAGVAAAEWHLHAWDLSVGLPERHEPAEPGVLFVAAGECVAAAEGGLKGALLARLVPVAARRSPCSTSERLRRAAEAAFDGWIRAVTAHLIAAGVDVDGADDLAVVLVGSIEGGFVLSRTKRSPEPLLAVARTLVPLVSSAIARASSASASS